MRGRGAPGTKNGHWKGGRVVDKNGYILIHKPDHPHARTSGYVLEHRLAMEEHIGRYLQRNEVVHHKNKVKDDNRIENLELFSSNADHLKKELTGHCPKWTKAGLRKIERALQKANRIRLGLDEKECK